MSQIRLCLCCILIAFLILVLPDYTEAASITSTAENGDVKITFTEVKKSTKYLIYRKTGTSRSFKLLKTLKSSAKRSYVDKNVSSGTTYYYKIKAMKGSKKLAEIKKTILYMSTPVLTVSNTKSGIKLQWKKITGAKAYKIYRKAPDSTKYSLLTSTSKTSFTDTVVRNGITYYYYIKACNNSYCSAASSKKSIKYSIASEVTVVPPTEDPEKAEEETSAETPSEPELVIPDNAIAYYYVKNGKVWDAVSNTAMEDATVDGAYFSGGTVRLKSKLTEGTIETVMVYNRNSTENPVGEGLSYYGGAFLFQEITSLSLKNLIKVPFGGGQTYTDYTLDVAINNENPVLPSGESHMVLAFRSEDNSYTVSVNGKVYTKEQWANVFYGKFSLSKEHKFKTFIVYDKRLSENQIISNFQQTGISATLPEGTKLTGIITNGLTDLGSAFSFTKAGTNTGIPSWNEVSTEKGTYTENNGNGYDITYEITDYEEPTNTGIDNSRYESLHFGSLPEKVYAGYKYALSAVPYPFDSTSDEYDISWESSNPEVASVMDGLLIAKKAGWVEITARLKGTEIAIQHTFTVEKQRETAALHTTVLTADYISPSGYSFNPSNPAGTTHAIYEAIDEAYEAGYNHIVFPTIDFYASPLTDSYYIPTGMYVEFPQGSTFHMVANELSTGNGYTYFRIGWDWYDYHIPKEKAKVEYDSQGNVLDYSIEDTHLIVDQYYGEFYKPDATNEELYKGANTYAWGCVFVNVGRKARYCTVEVHEAQSPAGFFILLGGKVGAQALQMPYAGVIKADEFEYGRLDDNGVIQQDSNWISTKQYYEVSYGAEDYDALHRYFLGNWEQNITDASQKFYDILWYDKDKNLIQANRYQYTDERYIKPAGAAYFKVSLQQTSLPTGDQEYIRIHPDASASYCEIRNTNVINGADGLVSVVGATKNCYIHDNYISGDGLLKSACWSICVEDGWLGIRDTIIEHNILRQYSIYERGGEYKEYSTKDSGILALSGGYNTFVISNYIGAIAQSNWNVTNTHIINNVVCCMYSSFLSGSPINIRPRTYAHVYYNIIGARCISNADQASGILVEYGNTYDSTTEYW